MAEPPSPHPLDFDWRYDHATAHHLADLLRDGGPVLALGAPSVARLLEGDGVEVALVDRQPLQGVQRHDVRAVEDFDNVTEFRTAIVDPPWYPRHLLGWSKAAARAVCPGGSVLVSVWPDHTRPHAVDELATVLAEISSWAEIERNVATLGYEKPRFEIAACACFKGGTLSRSPLHGELIRLTISRVPEPDASQVARTFWQRFTVDDYQLAVRLNRIQRTDGIRALPNANGWRWPFVSARAPNIDDVSIWSSEGEVGTVGDPSKIIAALRSAFASQDELGFEQALAQAPELLTWRIPRPPYRRSIEWLHRQ